jgi:MAP/microtubule affinity-regulating kinase
LAKDLLDSEKSVAIKVTKSEELPSEIEAYMLLTREVTMMKELDHVNIVKLITFGSNGFLDKSDEPLSYVPQYIIMEYVPISFFNVILSIGTRTEDISRFFFHQIVNAMAYMHAKDIAHLDLKPENIMVDKELTIKIADFGFATNKNVYHLTEYMGTKPYMAPELIERRTYNGKQADVFSLGVILYFLATGYYPFIEASKNDCYYKNFANSDFQQELPLMRDMNLSESLINLVANMLSYDSNCRFNIE